ncbi:MAG: RNA polymerase sigma factor [Candidatus Acidiferrales bacterium]
MKRDEELILEFQKGSTEAFTELFLRYRDPLYGFFRRRLSSSTRAEELAQECFLAILQGIEHYEPRATFRTYIYSIALRMIAAEYRKQSRELTSGIDPEEIARSESTELTLVVQSAIKGLDSDYREILMLREYEGLSYEEVATALKIPTNTVRSRLFRARMQLKAALETHASPALSEGKVVNMSPARQE